MSDTQAPFRWTEQTEFRSDGAIVTERFITHGTPPDDFPCFVGRASLHIRDDQGNIIDEQPVQFSIPEAEDMDAAFRQYPALVREAVERYQQKINAARKAAQNQIVLPQDGDTQAIMSSKGM